jgi:SAM-dependent methyltransferase
MLTEHLSQDHDLASRRTEWIDRQVKWIHHDLLKARPVNILDLGCGPGFYLHRLTMRGHRCHGIDFAPASIEYAQKHNPDKSRCRFVLADIRRAAFGGPYDLAMVLFGEFNVFSPAEARTILQSVQTSLNPRGILIIEAHTPEVVENMGRSEPSQQRLDSGLFSDRPHLYRTESNWLPDQKVALQTFYITEDAGAPAKKFHSTTKAWTDSELIALLKNAGFDEVAPCDNWPCNTDDLKLWLTRTQNM